MLSFPGQQNRMAISTCRFYVSENDHRSSHEDRASSCSYKRPSSLGFLLYRHLKILIAFHQKGHASLLWFRAFASSQKSTFIHSMARWVRLNDEVKRSHRHRSWNRRWNRYVLLLSTFTPKVRRIQWCVENPTFEKQHQTEVMTTYSVSKWTWRRVMRSWLELALQPPA